MEFLTFTGRYAELNDEAISMPEDVKSNIGEIINQWRRIETEILRVHRARRSN
jgi:hypothetical protein